MKNIIIIYLSLVSIKVSAYPAFRDKTTPCEINYYEFCQKINPNITNMCPAKIEESMKSNCLVNQFAKQVIKKSCKTELQNVCSFVGKNNAKEKDGSFLKSYLCLTNPKNWSEMNPECLKSLSRGLHSNDGEDSSQSI